MPSYVHVGRLIIDSHRMPQVSFGSWWMVILLSGGVQGPDLDGERQVDVVPGFAHDEVDATFL